MSFSENDYSVEHLLGNTNVPRNLQPELRTTNRRLDPDGTSAVPYFSGVSGKTLRINYTYELADVVTPLTVDVALSSNSLAAIITTINAADASNLVAVDRDGFLVISNRNPGKTHYLEIAPYSTPADDAAPILGFRVSPFPGSISYAGEIASSPGIRTEDNPQGTTLLGGAEDLQPGTFNRPLAQILQVVQDLRNELEKDVIVYREVSVTFITHPISNEWPSVEINDDTLRLPIEMMGLTGTPNATPVGILNPFFQLLSPNKSNSELTQNTSGESNDLSLDQANIQGVFYATTLTGFNDGSSFSVWGTPDGKSIYGSSVPNKDKHAAIAITSFDGNIAFCSGATFQTKYVKKNDPVEITNPLTTAPFDHSGWFAIEKVIDETHLALRPLATSERIPGAGNRPRSINTAACGDLRVAMGYFVPAVHLWLQSDFVDDTPNARIRMACAVSLREALAEDFAFGRTGTWTALAELLDDHIEGAADRHQTSQIGGSAISIGGSTPNLLSADTLLAQLTSLLTLIQTATNYAGSSPNVWGDGSTVAASSFETALDTIVNKLGATTVSDDGAKKIGATGSGDLTIGTVRSQLDQLNTEWGRLARTNTWTQAQTLNGTNAGDPSSNPVIITTQTASVAKLLWEIALVVGIKARLYAYVGNLGTGLAITLNAAYTTAAGWTADTNGNPALILLITADTFILAAKTSTGAAWADNTWLTQRTLTAAGVLTIVSASISGASINNSGAIASATGQGITAGAGGNVTVSGGGEFKHGDMILQIGAAVGRNNDGAVWKMSSSVAGQANFLFGPTSGDDAVFNIHLKIGDRIKEVRARVVDTTGTHTISMYVHKDVASGTLLTGSAQVGSTQTSAGNGTLQTLALTGLTETIVSGTFYNVIVRANDATTTTHRILGIEVTYDRP